MTDNLLQSHPCTKVLTKFNNFFQNLIIPERKFLHFCLSYMYSLFIFHTQQNIIDVSKFDKQTSNNTNHKNWNIIRLTLISLKVDKNWIHVWNKNRTETFYIIMIEQPKIFVLNARSSRWNMIEMKRNQFDFLELFLVKICILYKI